MLQDFVHQILEFIQTHPDWAALIIGLTAFGESFVFLSIIFPGTAVLIAAGAFAASGLINPFAAMFAGALGAILGDTVSFWIGQKFGPILPHRWPFRSHPETLARGTAFFQKYGGASVFIGRFFGPLRAVIPLIAGVLAMPFWRFNVANIGSALIWAPGLVLSGMLLGQLGGKDIESKIFIGAIVLGVAIPLLYWLRMQPWVARTYRSIGERFDRLIGAWRR